MTVESAGEVLEVKCELEDVDIAEGCKIQIDRTGTKWILVTARMLQLQPVCAYLLLKLTELTAIAASALTMKIEAFIFQILGLKFIE